MTIGKLTVAHIRAAWPTGAGKHIARELGTTVRNGRHIASTAQVPRRWRKHLLSIIDAAIERNETRLAELRRELRELSHEGGADPLAHRTPGMVGAAPPGVAQASGGQA